MALQTVKRALKPKPQTEPQKLKAQQTRNHKLSLLGRPAADTSRGALLQQRGPGENKSFAALWQLLTV